MPSKPPKPCAAPGCSQPTTDRYCEAHRSEQWRGTASQRGYTYRWAKVRRRFLKEHPLCAECQRQGLVVAATVVDHIVPHRGDQALFWDRENWQALCKSCHDAKTAHEVNERERTNKQDGPT